MENKKLTKKEYFGVIRNLVIDNEELVAFIDHEIELLNKKSSKTSPTATQKANMEVKDKIIQALVDIARPVTITELQAECPEMAEYSNQKLSALMKQLVDINQVVRVTDKKKSYFSVAE